MKEQEYIKIDYLKLREEGKLGGLNGRKLSTLVGKNPNWMEQHVYKQKVGKDSPKGETVSFVNIIEKMTGIPREKFILRPALQQEAELASVKEAQDGKVLSLLEKISKQLDEISGQLLILPKIMDANDSVYFQLCDMSKDLTKITEDK